MSTPELFPVRVITLRGIRHELDEQGFFCSQCGETAEYLLDAGGEASF